jgi:N-acetyl-1-D-myo-inositol-2-amino-2-deoxy-alpha-D-glucopyranoside deacetylase
MSEPRTLLVVHAHPDDEVFSTGGLLAKHAAAGDRTVVVYCTNGEAGEILDESLDPEEARPRLGEIRLQEVQEAARVLGISEVRFLGYRDSGMRDTEDNTRPDAFMNVPVEEAADRLLAIMRETRPQVVVTYDEEGGYGHPDHIMANRITVEAFHRAQQEGLGVQRLYYPARSREDFRRYVEGLRQLGLDIPWVRGDFNFDEYGVPESELSAIVDISEYVTLKKQALAVHRTQIKPDFFYLSIPDDVMRRLQGREFFQQIEPPRPPGPPSDDLFDGVETPGTEAVA